MHKPNKRVYQVFVLAVIVAMAAVQVRTILARNAQTAALARSEAQSFYQAVHVGMSRNEIEERAKTARLWPYEMNDYAIYRSRSWFASIACESSVNVRVDYDAHDRAARIGSPSTYVTACT